MPADTLRPLLDQMREFDARREADRRTRYAKLVLRVARAEDLGGPEQVTKAVEALGRDVGEFQEDVELAAERIELREIADQLAEHTAAREAAFREAKAAEAEYAAEARRIEEAFAAKIGAAWGAHQAAVGQVEAASRAARKLVETCTDTEAIDRIRELGRKRVTIREQIAKHQANARRHDDEATDAAHAEKRRAASVPLGFAPPETAQSEARRQLIAEAPALIAAEGERVAELQALVAELDAEERALGDRLLEPFPGVVSPRG